MNETPDVLVVDDDEVFAQVLATALTRRGWPARTAGDADAARAAVRARRPTHAVVDLRMPGESGLMLVPWLAQHHIVTVVLTGYASVSTAVEAIKLGAIHYLAKPTDADTVVAAFAREQGDPDHPVGEQPWPVDRIAWEHIQRVLAENDGNISATARALRMHRRTLQRKLAKKPVRE